MPDLLAPQLQFGPSTPDRMVMFVDVNDRDAQRLAINATWHARLTMPRVSGATARRLQPIWGEGYFGIYFPDPQAWFMEHGTKPRTMRSLAGKTIPMWVSDLDGSLRAKNPKIKVRTTEDGRLQVLIFRRAARLGQRKFIRRPNRFTGAIETVSVPMSYPGAPGRINRRVPGGFGPSGGQIATGNVGVRWRHPGLRAMQFLNSALAETAFSSGLFIGEVYATDGANLETLVEQQKRRVGQ
jgi:hypothetical protein